MTVCTFYQRGACNKGDACRFEHPGSQRDSNRGGFGSNTNRFAAFSGGGGGGSGDRYRPGQPQQPNSAFGAGRDPKVPRFHLSKDDIKADLTDQRPVYPLSCYGPGREAPRQLIEGPVEISPDELRLRYYVQRLSGNEPAAQQEERDLNSKMQQQVDSILKDLNGAIQYVEEGANVPGNRLDIAKGKAQVAAPGGSSDSSSNPFSKPPVNALGGVSQTQTSAFGQASTPAFGQPRLGPAFGQPSNPSQTAAPFGQSSTLGQTASPFGQSSALGQQASPFGQASALGGQGTFGKPSMPGTASFGQSSSLGGTGFGQTSALGGTSSFGKPSLPGAGSFGQPAALGSAFGQASSPGSTSSFGKPSVAGATSGFGQTNALGQSAGFAKPGFGQTGFGQASQPGANASPFGQQPLASQSSPFGQQQQPQAQASPFGGPQQQKTTQASPFAQQQPQPPQANPFGRPAQQQPTTAPNPFGGPGASQAPAFGQTGFNKPAPSPFATAVAPVQAANPFATKPQSPATAASPFGTQVQSPNTVSQQTPASPFAPTQQSQPAAVPNGGKPVDAKDRFKEGKPEEYEGEQGRILEEIYRRVGQLGRFNDDEDIPLIPPKCEWIVPIQLL